MTMPRMAVRPMEEADLDAVVQLHVLRFPSSGTTSFGRPFLRRMYHWFWKYHPGLSLVATADGRVVGFAVGSVGTHYQGQVARHSVIQLAWGVLRRPTLLLQRAVIHQVANLANQLRGLSSRWRRPAKVIPAVTVESAPPKMQVEIASLATAPSAAGVGLLLVFAFEAAAKRAGADLIAGTVRNENTSLREMYERLGWSHDWNVGSDCAYYRKQFRKAALRARATQPDLSVAPVYARRRSERPR